MRLTKKEKVSYGLGAVGKDMVYMLSANYILYYYQDIMGVSAFAMGVILMAARIFDAFNDPIMGVVVAKTKTRWGKFRPWLLIGHECHYSVSDVHGAACTQWWWTGCLCGSILCSLGCYLYNDGYSFLVHDSGVYRGW